MDELMPIWVLVMLIAAWTVVMCLKAIGKDVEHQEAIHQLRIDAKALQNEHRQQMRKRLEAAIRRKNEVEERRAARKVADKTAPREQPPGAETDTPDSFAIGMNTSTTSDLQQAAHPMAA